MSWPGQPSSHLPLWAPGVRSRPIRLAACHAMAWFVLLPPPAQVPCNALLLSHWCVGCRDNMPAYRNALAFVLLGESIPIM